MIIEAKGRSGFHDITDRAEYCDSKEASRYVRLVRSRTSSSTDEEIGSPRRLKSLFAAPPAINRLGRLEPLTVADLGL